ncbi:MAG: hypothetical protein IJY39_07990 [Clostridia bacterium]|nr:hypothetical protein [Clostridia bacterium]
MGDRSNEVAGAVHHMKKNGMLKLIIIGFAVGIALLLIGSFGLSEKEGEQAGGDVEAQDRQVVFLQYKETVRREVEDVCRSVSGVKNATAVVFFDGLGGSIYAQNTQSGSTDKCEYVIIGSGSNSHALYIGESLPQLSGIGVVCDTGGSASVRNEIAALLSATYGLPLTRVYVSEGK